MAAKALLFLAFSMTDNERQDYINNNWNPKIRCGRATHVENEKLSALYKLLTEIGYEMSDEEKALQNGTHEMFEVEDDEDKISG